MTRDEVRVGMRVVEKRAWWIPPGRMRARRCMVPRRGIVDHVDARTVILIMLVGARTTADMSLKTFLAGWRGGHGDTMKPLLCPPCRAEMVLRHVFPGHPSGLAAWVCLTCRWWTPAFTDGTTYPRVLKVAG